METIEDVVLSLNDLIENEQYDSDLLDYLVTTLNELCNSQIMLNYELLENLNSSFHSRILMIDFESHSEKKQENARFWKRRHRKLGNIMLAAEMFEFESECQKYIEFKKKYELVKSSFVILKNFIVYAYFGNTKNDRQIREFLTVNKGIKSLKLGYLIYCLKQ